jgi:hypothetical protein
MGKRDKWENVTTASISGGEMGKWGKWDSLKAPGQTGRKLGMQEPHRKGVANHPDIESCAGGGDITGEALTEALAGRAIEP